MDLWMMHESRRAELEQAQRELRMKCALADGSCWRRKVALRCGLVLLRAGRRLIAYGRTSTGPSMPLPPGI